MRRTLTESMIIVDRQVKKIMRVPFILYLSMFQALLWLVLFPQSFHGSPALAPFRAEGYTNYLMFFVPSALTMAMLSVAFQSGMSMVADIERGMLDKFLIAPIRRSSILLGKMMADAAKMLLIGSIVLGVAALMGASVRTGVGGTLVMLLVATLFGVVWAGLSNIVALRSKSTEVTLMIGVLFTFPMLFLSTAIMPRSTLPSWLQTVTAVNPVAYVVDSQRAVMNFGYDWAKLGRTLAVVVALGAFTLTGAARAFRKATGS